MLILASEFDASDAHDNVFAILSLLGHYADFIAPDYRMSVTEVYTLIYRAAIVNGISLDVPVIAQQLEDGRIESELVLPSWVMRFRDQLDPDTLVPLIASAASCAPGCEELLMWMTLVPPIY